MALRSESSKVLTKGGVLTPTYLNDILRVAEIAGNDSVFLGSRQEILFKQDESAELKVIQLKPDNFRLFDREFSFQNVVSSLASVDILPSTPWVNSRTYHNILKQIKIEHTLQINLVDPKQNLVPLFSGNLNFVASQTPGFWFLYLRKEEEEETIKWPGLIASEGIATLAMYLEKEWKTDSEITLDQLVHEHAVIFPLHTIKSDEELVLPKKFFSSYEGLVKSDDINWVDFYCADNHFPIQFMREVVKLCNQTGQDEIFITPWKTFLIKGISPQNKVLWKELISRYGLNVNYSSLELNWCLPLLDKKAFHLKNYLVDQLSDLEIRRFGLSFTIQTKPMEVYTTAVIKVDRGIKLPGIFESLRTYSIYYASDFNPNNSKYILFAENISKRELPQKIKELNNRFYQGNTYSLHPAWNQLMKRSIRQTLVLPKFNN
jgi:hypothetical protein